MLLSSTIADTLRNPSLTVVGLALVQLFAYISFAVWPGIVKDTAAFY